MSQQTGQTIDYAALSLSDVGLGLEAVTQDAQATFGACDVRQLNWRPDPARWSVAQCFEHLLTANGLMFRAAEEALSGTAPRTVWQRMPVMPRVVGRLLVRSQAPGATRKFKAPSKALPGASDIAADVVERFIAQQRDAVQQIQSLDEGHASRAIMTSPFVKVITYSVLDGWRLVLAHDRRHVEQARAVMLSPGFPPRLSVVH